MHPIRLVEFGCVFGYIFGVEVVVSSGNKCFVIDLGLGVGKFPWQGIMDGFDFVDIPVIFLLLGTDISIVLLKFLGGCEAGQQRVVRSHSNTNFIDINIFY